MQNTAAAVTMVKDDLFFLRAWLRHYGGMFGRENCYVINHGRGEAVAAEAAGCNVIGLPGNADAGFDIKRWRLLNGVVDGLVNYYTHVIVGDVDELVVLDPQTGLTLLDWLKAEPPAQVITPLGLEVIHRIDVEQAPIEQAILGPRRHVRVVPRYSKPCIISTGTKLARGGHYAKHGKLHMPDDLYLFHMKYCDFGTYVETANARNTTAAATGAGVKGSAIGRHWFAEYRGEDRALFDGFADLTLAGAFDMGPHRDKMRQTFGPRGDTGFFQFDLAETQVQYLLPDRFSGLC